MQSIDKATIGERIQSRRRELSLTQVKVAEEIGVSMAAISLWEKNKTNLSSENLQKLAQVLQCSVSWLLNGEDSFDNQVTTYTGGNCSSHRILKIFDLLPDKEKAKIVEFAEELLSKHAKALENELNKVKKNINNI
ncbi:helix-turn-helix domain-containing protein [Photorhabdus namnaonensis]|uniref:HTH-type transcriptional regulator Xre n=1 Tax=Photorhabdus namnaonensis TaxID=1851568 RepID=A0A1B8YJ94_9GAMM|nr:helix-turn-helix domain-containing protein [Photorhabdus namnaonensis]OCA55163.1 HTH-type transcriptional regulator Xre [Photorhabdus namnaonensis]